MRRGKAGCRVSGLQSNQQAAIWRRQKNLLVKGLLLEIGLGHLIGCPANGSTRHRGNDTRAHATQETTPAEALLDDGGGVPQTARRADLFTFSETASLEKSLDNVERSGDTGRESTSKTTSHAVGEGVVILLWVHELGDRLVGNELSGSEGDCHAKGGRIREVEGLETLSFVDGFRALHQRLVDGAVDLHSLLDNCLERLFQVFKRRQK